MRGSAGRPAAGAPRRGWRIVRLPWSLGLHLGWASGRSAGPLQGELEVLEPAQPIQEPWHFPMRRPPRDGIGGRSRQGAAECLWRVRRADSGIFTGWVHGGLERSGVQFCAVGVLRTGAASTCSPLQEGGKIMMIESFDHVVRGRGGLRTWIAPAGLALLAAVPAAAQAGGKLGRRGAPPARVEEGRAPRPPALAIPHRHQPGAPCLGRQRDAGRSPHGDRLPLRPRDVRRARVGPADHGNPGLGARRESPRAERVR